MHSLKIASQIQSYILSDKFNEYKKMLGEKKFDQFLNFLQDYLQYKLNDKDVDDIVFICTKLNRFLNNPDFLFDIVSPNDLLKCNNSFLDPEDQGPNQADQREQVPLHHLHQPAATATRTHLQFPAPAEVTPLFLLFLTC